MTAVTRDGSEYIHVHVWLIMFGVMFFGFFVAWDMKFIRLMLQTDGSYLSGASLVLFFAVSLYAFFHIVQNSRMIAAAQRGDASVNAPTLLRDYIRESAARPASGETGGPSVIEIYADRLRAPVELGWFVIDLLIRLGLIGTIIGFIMILLSLTSGPLPGASDIQRLLVTLGGGMGTALYTTLAGLVTASLLAMQYIVLGRCVENLIAAMIRMDKSQA
jgi:hypothetical protein